MGDETADVRSHPGQLQEGVTEFGDGSRAILHRLVAQFHIHMGQVDACPISITRGPAGSYLHPLEQRAGLEGLGESQAGAVGHLQRHSGIEHHRVHQGFLTELRQEHPPEARQDGTGHHNECQSSGQHPLGRQQREFQQGPVGPLRPGGHPGVLGWQACVRQQDGAERWRERERHQAGGRDREQVGQAHGRKDPPFHPREAEDRGEHHHDDHGGQEHRLAYLHGGFEHHLQGIPGLGGHLVAAQPGVAVLHVDDGVVDHRADRHHQTTEGHGVDLQPEGAHQHQADHQRQGDGAEGDHGGAPVHQKQHHHHGHDQDPFDQGSTDVLDRRVNEIGLPEGARHLNVARQSFAEGGDPRLHLAGHPWRVDVGLFVDHQHHRRLAVEAAIAALQGARQPHHGDITEAQRLALAVGHHGIRKILTAARLAAGADQLLLPAGDQKAARGIGTGGRCRLGHGLQRHLAGL